MSSNISQMVLKKINEFELILNLQSELNQDDLETIRNYFDHLVVEIIKNKHKLRKHVRVNTRLLVKQN